MGRNVGETASFIYDGRGVLLAGDVSGVRACVFRAGEEGWEEPER